MKINNVNFFLFCFIIQLASGQIFQTERLKKRASLLYQQGMYPNVNQAFALFEDYNSSEEDLLDISYFQMVTSLRLNEPGAIDLIENLGSEKIIYTHINGNEIRIKSNKNINDKNVKIYLPKNKLYLFDNNKNRLNFI